MKYSQLTLHLSRTSPKSLLSLALALVAAGLFAACQSDDTRDDGHPASLAAPGEGNAVAKAAPGAPVDDGEAAAADFAAAAVATGLDFPSNNQGADTRFRFTGAARPPMYPVTYIWRVNHRQQAGYYATFFWGPDAAFYGVNYYGARPYPDGPNTSTSTSHKWSIAAYGQDVVTDANGHSTQLGHGVWKTQAFRAYLTPGNAVHEYYWDLPDTTKVIRQLLPRSYGASPPASAVLTFGASPGSPSSQRLSGILRGMQIYNVQLPTSDILAEVNSPLGTASGAANVWYLNLDPTPTDIADKSGKGHNPEWVGTGRPALWTDGTPPPPVPTVTLTANPATVNSGGSSVLSWSSTNATSCNASGAWSGAKPLSGSETLSAVTATGTYTLTCAGSGGSASQSVTVTVSSQTPPPTINLSANPTSVNSGGTSTLSWTTANATSCVASGGWSGSRPLSGSATTPALSATTTFTLSCTGAGGSTDQSVTVTVVTQPGNITGLSFPSNGQTSSDIRFRFRGSNLQPMYPITLIFRVNLRRQAGYYTTFFWGPDGAFTGTSYYGAHPYPDGSNKPTSTNHHWSMAINGSDPTNDANGNNTQVAYDTWHIQAFRAFDNGVNKVHEFYWNLPDTTKVIRVLLPRSYGPPPNPALTFGDAPWAVGNERLSGILRGMQFYNVALSPANILSEVNNPLGTPSGSSGIWYLNLNPTPSDISDKSGKGHQPEWVSSARPALWTGP